MKITKGIRYFLGTAGVVLICFSMVSIMASLSMAAGPADIVPVQISGHNYNSAKELTEEEMLQYEQKQREKRRKEWIAKTPEIYLGDIVDVRVDKAGQDEVKIGILTNSPLIFETTRGVNSEGVNHVIIEIPNFKLLWSDGEERTIEIGHAGCKSITLSQVYKPVCGVKVSVEFMPKASYVVGPTLDARGVEIKVKKSVPELPVTPEKPKEKLPLALISVDVVDADIQQVLKLVSQQSKMNIVTHSKVKGEITVHLKDVPLDQALDILLSINGLSYAKIGSTILVGPKEAIEKKTMRSKVIKLKHIDAEDARDILAGLIDDKDMQTNKLTNSIIITAIPDKIEQAESIVSQVDNPVPQVQLNAKIIEVGVDASRELGIDWSKGIGVTFRENDRDMAFDALGMATGGPFYQIYNFARTAFEAKLQALVDEGNAKILSSPRIMAMKDQEASIFIGDRIPYTVTNATGGVAVTEVRFTESGIKLSITPQIVNEDFVVMDIAPEVSYIYSFRGPDNEYPWIKTREAKANVRIRNGETLVLGGLLNEEDKKSIKKVPFLGDIPFLGEAFKTTSTKNNNTELLIVVTPTIIKGE